MDFGPLESQSSCMAPASRRCSRFFLFFFFFFSFLNFILFFFCWGGFIRKLSSQAMLKPIAGKLVVSGVRVMRGWFEMPRWMSRSRY